MKKEVQPSQEYFSVDKFKAELPSLRDELEAISTFLPVQIFLSTLTVDDFLLMYTEWLYRQKKEDLRDQRGFAFEVMCQRYISTVEPGTELGIFVKKILLFMGQSYNNLKIWDSEQSTPDDLGITVKNNIVYVSKIYESKISIHALERSVLQRIRTKETLGNLINALNGSDRKIKNREGVEIVCAAMEYLFEIADFPLELAQDCRYIYLLPSDQVYSLKHGEKKHFETLNLPISSTQIEKFTQTTVNFFKGI